MPVGDLNRSQMALSQRGRFPDMGPSPTRVGVCTPRPLPPLDWQYSDQLRQREQDKQHRQAETQAGYQAEQKQHKPMITLQIQVNIINVMRP